MTELIDAFLAPDFFATLFSALRRFEPNVHILVITAEERTNFPIRKWDVPGVVDVMFDNTLTGAGRSMWDMMHADVFVPAPSSFSGTVIDFRAYGVNLFPQTLLAARARRTPGTFQGHKTPMDFVKHMLDPECAMCMWTKDTGSFDARMLGELLDRYRRADNTTAMCKTSTKRLGRPPCHPPVFDREVSSWERGSLDRSKLRSVLGSFTRLVLLGDIQMSQTAQMVKQTLDLVFANAETACPTPWTAKPVANVCPGAFLGIQAKEHAFLNELKKGTLQWTRENLCAFPVGYGLTHAGCMDCRGCAPLRHCYADGGKRLKLEYFPMDYPRDCSLYANPRGYATTQDAVIDWLQRSNAETDKTVVAFNTGAMSAGVDTTDMYAGALLAFARRLRADPHVGLIYFLESVPMSGMDQRTVTSLDEFNTAAAQVMQADTVCSAFVKMAAIRRMAGAPDDNAMYANSSAEWLLHTISQENPAATAPR